jgi:hypothetical protein
VRTHADGTPVDPIGTQLFAPAMRARPPAQRTSCSTSTVTGPPPRRTMALLCMTMLASPLKSRNAARASGPSRMVLLTKR